MRTTVVMKMSILIQKVRYSVTTSHPPRRQKQCQKTMSCQPTGAAYYNTKLNKSWVEKCGCQLGMTLVLFYVVFATSVSPGRN